MQPDDPVVEAQLEARRWLAIAEEDLLGATAMLERDDVAPASPASSRMSGPVDARLDRT